MKKILASFLAVAVIAAGFFFFFNGAKKGLVTPAAFLPEDVLICLTQKDLGRILDDFRDSRLGKALTTIDLVQMAEEMGLPEEKKSMVKTAQEEGRSFLNGPIFKEIFSNEFSVALLPFDVSTLDIPLGIEEHLLLIAKPGHGTQLISLLTSGFGKALKQTTTSYGSHTIKRFQLEKEKTLVTVAVQDLVLMSLDERIIHDSLDRYDGKKRSLSDDDHFRNLKTSFEEPVFFSYFGMESLKKQMELLIEETDLNQKDILRDELRQWNGVRSVGYGVWQESDRIRDKGVFIVDNEKLHQTLKNLYGTSPEKNTTLAFVPQQVLAYYWTNTLDLQAYWKMYLEGPGGDEEKIDSVRKAAKKISGIDIETILGLLDKQCGLMIEEGDAKKFLPIPDISIFIRLKDSRRFSELARTVLENNAIQVQVQNYKDIEIMSMAGVSQGGLLPVYAIHDSYLFVASSMAMIKEIIDTAKDGHGLADNTSFQKVNSKLLEENNSVGYIRIGDLMRSVKRIVNWGRAIVAIQDQENAKRMEVLIDRLINPLLDGLSMYSVLGLRSHIAPNQIIIESTTLIEK